MVSNIVSARLDGELQLLAKRHRCTYSRYADDITFSTTARRFPEGLASSSDGWAGTDLHLGAELVEVVSRNGFNVNPDKSRLQIPMMRQSVTGLTVNRFVNVPRPAVRQIRAMLHAWSKYGEASAQAEYLAKYNSRTRHTESAPRFAHVVRGKLEFLRMVKGSDSPTYRRLALRLAGLDSNFTPPPVPSNSVEALIEEIHAHPPNLAGRANQGTMTILFTDIVNSTAINEQVGDQVWVDLLDEHNRIVRASLDVFHGMEIKTIGDAFLLIFQSSIDAVQFAIEVQRQFRERNKVSKRRQLHLRVGLHIGEPISRDGDVFGAAVNVASRVQSSAEPDEIVISELVYRMVNPRGTFLIKERPPRSFKGLEGEQLTYSVAWDVDRDGS